MRAKFIKHKDPRKTLGLSILDKREFNSYEEFIDWLYKYLVPHFYGMKNGPELWYKIKKLIKRDNTIIPQELYEYINEEIGNDVKISRIPLSDQGGWQPSDLRERYSFPTSNTKL